MAGKVGLEPTTYGTKNRCSTIELLPNTYWSGRPGSNWRHSDWKSDALPTELHPLKYGGATGSRTQ